MTTTYMSAIWDDMAASYDIPRRAWRVWQDGVEVDPVPSCGAHRADALVSMYPEARTGLFASDDRAEAA